MIVPASCFRANYDFDSLRAKLLNQLLRRLAVGDDGVDFGEIAELRDGAATELRVVETEDDFRRRAHHGELDVDEQTMRIG